MRSSSPSSRSTRLRVSRPQRVDSPEFAAEWGERYPAIVQLWENAWAEFVPFLEYDVEIRRVICTGVRDRVDQCPLSVGSPRPRALSQRGIGARVPVLGDAVP
ncbi:transposase [Rhodococcus aetherivorans]